MSRNYHNYIDSHKGYSERSHRSGRHDRDNGNSDKYYHGWGSDKDKSGRRGSSFDRSGADIFPDRKIQTANRGPSTTQGGISVGKAFDCIKERWESVGKEYFGPPHKRGCNQWREREIGQELDTAAISHTMDDLDELTDSDSDLIDMEAPPPPIISNTSLYNTNDPEPAGKIASKEDSDDPFSAKFKEGSCYFNPDQNDVKPTNIRYDEFDITEDVSNFIKTGNQRATGSWVTVSKSPIEKDNITPDKMTRKQDRIFQKALAAGYSRSQALQISEQQLVNLGFVTNQPTGKHLYRKHLDLVRTAITEAEAYSNFRAEILSVSLEKGWIKIACTPSTAVWLKSQTKHFQRKCEVKINIVEEADFPSTYTVRGNFPDSVPDSTVLTLIEAQNKIDVTFWKMLHSETEDAQHYITFNVDGGSWSKLLERNGVISYGFNQIKLDMNELINFSKRKSNEIDKSVTQTSNANKLFPAYQIPSETEKTITVPVEQKKSASTFFVRGDFPNSHTYTDEMILSLIKVQNKLDISAWNLVLRESNDSDLYITIEIDEASWNEVKKLNSIICYRFGKINLEMIGKSGSDKLEISQAAKTINDPLVRHKPQTADKPVVQKKRYEIPRTVRGNFPLSNAYTNAKVLSLIKAQNDLDVSLWKPLQRKTNDSVFTFEVDDNSWDKLQKANGLISYRFERIKLEMIGKNKQSKPQCESPVMETIKPDSANKPSEQKSFTQTVRGNFPQSNEYSNGKVLALIKSKNDLDISLWKPLERDTNDSIFAFEVDDNSWHKLQETNGLISYRFGRIKLELINSKSCSARIPDGQCSDQLPKDCVGNTESIHSISDKIPTRHIIRGRFPRSHKYSNEKILVLIKVQNSIDVLLWKIVHRKRENSIDCITFEIDEKSWQKLLLLKCSIAYGLSQIPIELIETKGHTEQQSTPQVAEPIPTVPLSHAIRGNFPLSHAYTSSKVLALIQAQNELDVSQWKPMFKKPEDKSLFTFEIDDSSWQKLFKLNGVISYCFRQVKLEMIVLHSSTKANNEDAKARNPIAALLQSEKSPMRMVQGNFPQSNTYTSSMVLAIIKAQNDLDIAKWKPLPKKIADDSCFAFEVDDNSWHKLLKLNGLVSYRFGQIKLELIDLNISNATKKDCTDVAGKHDISSTRLDELKNRIAARYEQMHFKSTDNGNPEHGENTKSKTKITPQKPYDKPGTFNQNTESSNPLIRLAELKNRIANSYDRIQVKLTDNTDTEESAK